MVSANRIPKAEPRWKTRPHFPGVYWVETGFGPHPFLVEIFRGEYQVSEPLGIFRKEPLDDDLMEGWLWYGPLDPPDVPDTEGGADE